MHKDIYISKDGKEYTDQLKNWTMTFNSEKNQLRLKLKLNSGEIIEDDAAYFEIQPMINLLEIPDSSIRIKGQIESGLSEAKEYGSKYTVVTFSNSSKTYIYKTENVEILSNSNKTHTELMKYFELVAEEKDSAPDNMPAIFKPSMEKLQIFKFGALDAYLSKRVQTNPPRTKTIYPFGLNLSQKQAVQQAFKSQISVIEGPPGTGKTQTILNILANIVQDEKTAAVVSSNNDAVNNVREKFEKNGYGFLFASLGNQTNQKTFFENQGSLPDSVEMNQLNKDLKQQKEAELPGLVEQLETLLERENRLAVLKQELKDLQKEKSMFEDHISMEERYEPKLLPFVNWSTHRIQKLLFEEKQGKIPWWKLFFFYGIYDRTLYRNSKTWDQFMSFLRMTYYERTEKKHLQEKEKLEIQLAQGKPDKLRQKISDLSVRLFDSSLAEQYKGRKFKNYTIENFTKITHFPSFKKRYPITLSTAHSLLASAPEGYEYDYVIIDEASQLELMPGIFALSCAKNVIVVGDNKQLPHIPVESSELRRTSVDPGYDYLTKSLLSSIMTVLEEKIPITLLKEHYRCDPMIIKFCNENYYNGELIPLSQESDEKPLVYVSTAEGNHMRTYGGNYNNREIESLKEETLKQKLFPKNWTIGFIAPYRKQVAHAEDRLPEEIKKDTVHKFQGRECDGIIFSGVLDQTGSNRMFHFVEQTPLVNVAVSRAKKKFVLVCDPVAYKKSNKEIAHLIRYMSYHTNHVQFHESGVVSVFDILYSRSSNKLLHRKQKLKPEDSKYMSEQIIASVLRDIFENEPSQHLAFIHEYRLKDLVKPLPSYTKEELSFMMHGSTIDFLIYYKIGKEAALAIEVDGSANHNEERPKQNANDQLKNSILQKADFPLLRLRTDEAWTEEQIYETIKKKMFGTSTSNIQNLKLEKYQ